MYDGVISMSKAKKLLLLFGDIVSLYASLALTLVIRYQEGFSHAWKGHVVPFSVIFLIWLFIFYVTDLYRQQTLRNTADLLKKVAGATIVSAALSMAAFYIFFSFFELTPKTNLLIFTGVFLCLSYGLRFFMLKAFTGTAIRVVFVGSSPLLRETVFYLKNNPHAGYAVARWIDLPSDGAEEIAEAVEKERAELIVIQEEHVKDLNLFPVLYQLLSSNTGFMNFLDFYETVFEKVPVSEVEKYWLIENIPSRLPTYDIAQRALDFLAALFLIIILSPIGILVSFLILVTSGFPVIYSQKRIGKNDILFTIYKFRTMGKDAEKNGPLYAQTNDPRLTHLGKVLRHTHLDEIPQLINIIKSDIAFVGPRPERPNFVEQFKTSIPYYNIRHLVKPGLTGWAQINYRYTNESVEETKEKLSYDVFYIKHRSIALNILIILKTLRRIFISAK